MVILRRPNPAYPRHFLPRSRAASTLMFARVPYMVQCAMGKNSKSSVTLANRKVRHRTGSTFDSFLEAEEIREESACLAAITVHAGTAKDQTSDGERASHEPVAARPAIGPSECFGDTRHNHSRGEGAWQTCDY